ncbi:Polyisoprenoid-binding protein YceI [Filimonas lacunae]|uniref:Polyisoprenoid-binding protein YceI n=1 Tax=Filimonas lacunae TaxID=477680 RepID=A0A173MP13_9BACT|nr:YceI family protein [Filimonas lacunae]BAV09374.1 rhodanese-like domain protein [Filimonas lacunae]SIS71999.1 Polyisoprenoid-binding protein YceI [Filimonas lacunae]
MLKQALSLAVIGAVFLASCNDAPKTDAAATGEKQEAAATTGNSFNIDPTATTLEWHTAHKGGVDPHTGSLAITSGTLAVDNGALTGGSFVVSTASIQDKDLTDTAKRAMLEGHLKSPDFFDVAKYPTAKFEITKVEAYDSTKGASLLPGATHFISGNLTLKDSTKNVTFPAKVTITAETVEAQANFNIDRTLWGMNYKGPNNPQDWMIQKEVNLKLDLKAKK